MIAIPIDKPKNCQECPAHTFNYGYIPDYDGCRILKRAFNVDKLNINPFNEVLPDCPLIEMVTCGECKHKPIKYDPEGDDFGFNLVSPKGYDNLCPCLNTDDGFYSYMPDDNFFCAYGERRSDENSDMDNSDNRTD